MATPKWQAGQLYPTGSLVQPLSAVGGVSAAITNPGFESLAVDWTLGAGMSVGTSTVFAGTRSLACTGTGGLTTCVHDEVSVNPGQSITATCMYQQGAASSGRNVGRVFLRWYNASMVQIGADSDGSAVSSSSGGYKQSTVTAIAPATAAFVSIGGKVVRDASQSSYFDNFAWNYSVAPAPGGLVYRAVQPTIGTSDADEPTWPLTVGVQVTDGTVIWEAIIATRITYEASPILVSGATEPTWPEEVGEFVSDGTISWEAVPRQVIEAPQSKVVTIASSKVYAADGDIVRYSATVNPLDWTSPDDAGYLPTGLNQYGSNKTAVLNTYRGNVVPFSSSTFQNWQVDPDPANITMLDTMEGIGSTWQHAAHPVANDLFYLAKLGVRTVGISAGTSNLAAGDAGAPIDPLVRRSIIAAEGNETDALGMYFPSLGQYWLAFPDFPPEPPIIHGDLEYWGIGLPLSGFSYTGTFGVKPYVFSMFAGTTLPPGLTLNSNGSVTGTPTTLGEYTWQVELTDAFGATSTLTDTAQIVNGPLITGNAPDANIGVFYSYAYTITVGDSPIASVEVIDGAIPDGMSLSSVGVLFGTPISDGDSTFTFTIRVTDDNGIFSDVTDTVAMAAFVSAYLPLNTDFTDLTGRTWAQIDAPDPVACVPTPTADGSGSMQVDTTFNFPNNIGIYSAFGSGAPGTGPFCLEGYFYIGDPSNPPANANIGLCGLGEGGAFISFAMRYPPGDGTAPPVATISNGTDTAQNTRQVLAKLNWYHWAVCRDTNDDVWLFVDGKKSVASFNDNIDLSNVRGVRLGCSFGDPYSFISNIDNCRLTTGWSRYTSDFTPPPAPMPYP